MIRFGVWYHNPRENRIKEEKQGKKIVNKLKEKKKKVKIFLIWEMYCYFVIKGFLDNALTLPLLNHFQQIFSIIYYKYNLGNIKNKWFLIDKLKVIQINYVYRWRKNKMNFKVFFKKILS